MRTWQHLQVRVSLFLTLNGSYFFLSMAAPLIFSMIFPLRRWLSDMALRLADWSFGSLCGLIFGSLRGFLYMAISVASSDCLLWYWFDWISLSLISLQMAEDYAASERLRRSLESERDELQEELNSLGGNRSNLAEDKRRLEARIQQVRKRGCLQFCNLLPI